LPGVTVVFARLIVPVVTIGPPVRPVPVATFVTVPLPATTCQLLPFHTKKLLLVVLKYSAPVVAGGGLEGNAPRYLVWKSFQIASDWFASFDAD